MMVRLLLVSMLFFAGVANAMVNPWHEGSRIEIMGKAGFSAPAIPSVERCGQKPVWRYLPPENLVEAICPRGEYAETRMRVSTRALEGDHVMYAHTSREMYKGVSIALYSLTRGGSYVKGEFKAGGLNYEIYIKPGTDLEAMMRQIRAVIDATSGTYKNQ